MKHVLINSLTLLHQGKSMKNFERKLIRLVLSSALFIGTSASAMQQGAYELKQKTIMAAYGLGKVGVLHDKEGFKVKQNGNIRKVHNYDLDHSLRDMDSERLAQLEKMGACLLVKKFDNGDFKLQLSGRLQGGGVGGAAVGASIGGTAVVSAYSLMTYGVTVAAGAMCGPATAAVIVGNWCWWTMAPAAYAVKVGTLAGGIAGGAATGPI